MPYRDHIVALHLGAVEVPTGPAPAPGCEAVVYVRSMIDNQLTPEGALRPGDQVRLTSEP